jgi:hypothetical protein
VWRVRLPVRTRRDWGETMMNLNIAAAGTDIAGGELAAKPTKVDRKTAVAVGVLFFVATAAYMAGSGLIASALGTPGEESATRLRVGVFLEFVNAVAVVGIGTLLFPILRRSHAGLALAYAGSRIIQAALLVVSAGGALFFASLDREYALRWHDLTFQLAMVVLGVGSLALCALLYRYRLVPRPLSLLGLCGYVALIAYGALALVGRETGYALFVPGAAFEVLFPLWLIVKGFTPTPAPSRPAV